MRRSYCTAVVVVVAPLLLVACETNEQTGGLVGAGGGAVLGGVLGNVIGHNAAGTAIGAALGAGAGYFIGSAIGRQLDQRDRDRAAAATQQALAAPVTYTSSGAPPVAHPVAWSSDHNNGVRGSTTVVAVQRQASGGECRTVHEVAYIQGKEVDQNSRYCRSADGSWAQA